MLLPVCPGRLSFDLCRFALNGKLDVRINGVEMLTNNIHMHFLKTYFLIIHTSFPPMRCNRGGGQCYFLNMHHDKVGNNIIAPFIVFFQGQYEDCIEFETNVSCSELFFSSSCIMSQYTV